MSLNTRTPACSNKIIHLRVTTKDASQICLTNLFCLNSNTRYCFKQGLIIGSDAICGAELTPELLVIVHGWIVKGGVELVKEIIGVEGGLKVFLDMGLVD